MDSGTVGLAGPNIAAAGLFLACFAAGGIASRRWTQWV